MRIGEATNAGPSRKTRQRAAPYPPNTSGKFSGPSCEGSMARREASESCTWCGEAAWLACEACQILLCTQCMRQMQAAEPTPGLGKLQDQQITQQASSLGSSRTTKQTARPSHSRTLQPQPKTLPSRRRRGDRRAPNPKASSGRSEGQRQRRKRRVSSMGEEDCCRRS